MTELLGRQKFYRVVARYNDLDGGGRRDGSIK